MGGKGTKGSRQLTSPVMSAGRGNAQAPAGPDVQELALANLARVSC